MKEDKAKLLDDICKELDIDKTKAIDALSIGFKEYRRILKLETLPYIQFGGIYVGVSKLKTTLYMTVYNALYRMGFLNLPQYMLRTFSIYYHRSRKRYFSKMKYANKYRAQSFIKHHDEANVKANLNEIRNYLVSMEIPVSPKLDRDTYNIQVQIIADYLNKRKIRKTNKQ